MVTIFSGRIETEQEVVLLYNYVKTTINANLRQDLIPDGLEAICLEIKRTKSAPFFVISWYTDHHANSPAEISDKFEAMIRKLEAEDKKYHNYSG